MLRTRIDWGNEARALHEELMTSLHLRGVLIFKVYLVWNNIK